MSFHQLTLARRVSLAAAGLLFACSGTEPTTSSSGNGVGGGAGAAGAPVSAGAASNAGSSSGGATTSAAGGTTLSGSGPAAASGAGGAAAGTGNANGGSSGAVGNAGAAGSAGASPLQGTPAIMVLGSSNELITCWRAFLWKKLEDAGIKSFDFVGGVTDGPDCNTPGYDKDLQAMSGIIISNLPPSQYAAWFSAHEPDIILMHFGGADILSNMPVDGVMQAYTTALEQARLVNPKVRLFIAQHTPQAANTCNDCDVNVRALNAAIAEWAPQKSTAESPVVVVDLYTGLVTATDFSDGVHLNESGSQKVSDRFFAVLKPLFQP